MNSFWYLVTSFSLFAIGIFGFAFSRRNFVTMLMAIEIMLLSANLLFSSFAIDQRDVDGQIFVLFSLTISAAEAAIGLAIFIVYFRQKTSILADHPNHMRG